MSDIKFEGSSVPEQMRDWLTQAVQSGASDLHLIVGHPPVMRVHGDLVQLSEPALDPDEIQSLLSQLCRPEALSKLQSQKNVDFSFGLVVKGRINRFRANLFHSGRQLAGCFRVVPNSIPELDWANFPMPLARKLAGLNDGLVILCGATGSGKTTTLAMIVNLINQAGGYRIITVEEPVEYQFPKKANSVVTQREVGADVLSFADGLKYGLRQDPDVILVGEVRDRETAQMALSAAETGHLGVHHAAHPRRQGCHQPLRRPVSPGRAARHPLPTGDEPEVRRMPAIVARRRKGRQTPPGPGGDVEHLSDRQRHSPGQAGKHRQLFDHQPGRRHGQHRRIGGDAAAHGKITRAVAEQNVRDTSMLNRLGN